MDSPNLLIKQPQQIEQVNHVQTDKKQQIVKIEQQKGMLFNGQINKDDKENEKGMNEQKESGYKKQNKQEKEKNIEENIQQSEKNEKIQNKKQKRDIYENEQEQVIDFKLTTQDENYEYKKSEIIYDKQFKKMNEEGQQHLQIINQQKTIIEQHNKKHPQQPIHSSLKIAVLNQIQHKQNTPLQHQQNHSQITHNTQTPIILLQHQNISHQIIKQYQAIHPQIIHQKTQNNNQIIKNNTQILSQPSHQPKLQAQIVASPPKTKNIQYNLASNTVNLAFVNIQKQKINQLSPKLNQNLKQSIINQFLINQQVQQKNNLNQIHSKQYKQNLQKNPNQIQVTNQKNQKQKHIPNSIDQPYKNMEFSRTSSIIEYLQRNKQLPKYPQMNQNNLDNIGKNLTSSGRKLYLYHQNQNLIGKIIRRNNSSQKKQQTPQVRKSKQEFRIRQFNKTSSKYSENSRQNQLNGIQFQSPNRNKLGRSYMIGKIYNNTPDLKNSRMNNNKILTQQQIIIPVKKLIPISDEKNNQQQISYRNAIKYGVKEKQSQYNIKKLNSNPRSIKKTIPAQQNLTNSIKKQIAQYSNSKINSQLQLQQANQDLQVQTKQNNRIQFSPYRSKLQNQQNSAFQVVQDQSQSQKSDPQYQKQFDFQMPKLPQIPTPQLTSDQLINLGRTIFQLFNVLLDDELPLNIKKYRNCVYFNASNKNILWHYSGKFYFGDWSHQKGEGQKSGQGIQYLPQKYIYKGEFKEGKRNGFGAMKLFTGEIYKGHWNRGLRHGKGKLIQKSGVIYDGQWNEGKKHGYGKLILSPNEVYQGIFQNGFKNGFGKQTFRNGDNYQGDYLMGKFSGKGIYTWNNKSSYTGQFLNGTRHGKGFWRSNPEKGDIYQGEYKNDKKSGTGKYTWENGTSYIGTFENDLRHGQGLLKLQNGKQIRAVWQNGIAKKKIQQVKNSIQDKTGKKIKRKEQIDDPLIKKRIDIYQYSLKKINESENMINKISDHAKDRDALEE